MYFILVLCQPVCFFQHSTNLSTFHTSCQRFLTFQPVCLSYTLSTCLSSLQSVSLTVFHTLFRPVCLSYIIPTCLSFLHYTNLSVFLTLYRLACLSYILTTCLSFLYYTDLSVFLTLYQPVCLSNTIPTCLSFLHYTNLSVFLTLYRPVCLSYIIPTCLSFYHSVISLSASFSFLSTQSLVCIKSFPSSCTFIFFPTILQAILYRPLGHAHCTTVHSVLPARSAHSLLRFTNILVPLFMELNPPFLPRSGSTWSQR